MGFVKSSKCRTHNPSADHDLLLGFLDAQTGRVLCKGFTLRASYDLTTETPLGISAEENTSSSLPLSVRSTVGNLD